MSAELEARNFQVNPDAKAATQDWVRTSIIPELVKRDYGSERVLNILHYTATYGLENQAVPTQFVAYREAADEMGLLNGVSSRESSKRVHKLMDNRDPDVKVRLAGKKARGRYRKIADVQIPRLDSDKKVPLWRMRAIQVFTREGEMAYIAPQLKIDELMTSLGEEYDAMETRGADGALDVAMRLAYFYTIGNRIIHPYEDANHRAFDRFLEYGFAKKGIPFELPQDETGNIPLDDLFRARTTNFAFNFLTKLRLPLFETQQDYQRFGRDRYQNFLYMGIQELIESKFNNPSNTFFYALVAEQILKWTGQDHTEEIQKIQQKAIEDGNLTVVHRTK